MDDREMFYGADKNVFRKAYMLRSHETETEKLLWKRLSKNQLGGFRFKRQHPVANYIADFYCHKAKLVIEIDGNYHSRNDQKLYDENRTKTMKEFGLRVLRLSDEDIAENMDEIIEVIKNYLR